MDEEIAADDGHMISKEAKQLAQTAMVADCWIGTDVRCTYLRPRRPVTTHVRRLYPELPTPPATEATTKSRAILALTERMSCHSRKKTSLAEHERLASDFLRLLGSRNVEYFNLLDRDDSHPQLGFSYWTFWILALDQPLGRSVALALGASD